MYVILTTDLQQFFADSGPLANAIPGYRLRPQQLEMARAVAQAIESNGLLIAEAGTGTGKTFAYLVPALSRGGKVIVSTGTKTLQDQLYHRDIPMVRNALQAPVTVALLKGRANYVCHYHLERARNDGRFLNRDDVVYLARIESYAKTSKTGDRGGLAEVPEDATVWPLVRSAHSCEQRHLHLGAHARRRRHDEPDHRHRYGQRESALQRCEAFHGRRR